MSTFDDREKAFEAKFAHDEALTFKAHARRNRALGIWAAEKLGLNPEETDAYVRTLIEVDLEEAGSEDVYRRLKADFDAKNIDMSEHRLRRTMDELLADAVKSVREQG